MEDVDMNCEAEHEAATSSGSGSKSDMLNNLEGPNLTFQIHEEDHTLGNVLRHLAMLNPNTTFAGYAIPHPSISTMNLRIETLSNIESGENSLILDLKSAQSAKGISNKKASAVNQGERVGATSVLLKSCDDLNLICDRIEDQFDKAIKQFTSAN
ncbi:DNA-directed RNA polymerase I and III subunit RPAC2 [Cryptosporidium felis]|nr:DNA-directed RNA polymerase I and III subunit RPAC2 [Cryptosporidium felis]